MLMSVYLHPPIANLLRCFGDLDTVVNKILQEGEAGNIQLENLEPCQDRVGASRYDINITNEYYLALLDTYPQNSAKISLRRILYSFVENEIYEELGWSATHEYIDTKRKKLRNKIIRIKSDVSKLQKDTRHQACETILTLLDNIMEDIK